MAPPRRRPTEREVVRQQEAAYDQAEEALVAALLTFLLAQGVTKGRHISQAELLAIVQAIAVPYAVMTAIGMLDYAPTPVDTRNWQEMATELVTDVVERTYPSVVREFDDVRREDIYERSEHGPVGIEAWAQRIAGMIALSVAEGMKRSIAEALGFTHRKWMTRLDSRVRETHRLLEGVTRPTGEPFVTRGGARLMYPGDPTAPIEEWIRCRCSLLYIAREEGGQMRFAASA